MKTKHLSMRNKTFIYTKQKHLFIRNNTFTTFIYTNTIIYTKNI